MPHFKAPNDTLHFLSDEDIASGGIEMLPAGCVEITEAEATSIRAVTQPVPVPSVVSRFQARAALMQANLLTNAESLVAKGDALTRMAWAEATEFKRTSPLVVSLGTQLGLSESQLDDLFRSAAAIEV